MSRREPVFNLSETAPLRFAGLLVALYALIILTPLYDSQLLEQFLVLRPLKETSGWRWLALGGHGVFHASWSHVLLNATMLVVFGILTMRGARAHAVLQGVRGRPALVFVAIWLIGVVGGGVAQWLWWMAVDAIGWADVAGQSAVGASGGVSALFASAAWAMGGRETVVKFGIGWALINLVFVVFESVIGVGIAWAAHLGGYLAGALVAPLWMAAGVTGFDPR